MRKTVLVVTAACMVGINGWSATEIINKTENPIFVAIENVNISVFCNAIVKGEYDIVKRLIDLGEDVNKKALGMKPAMFASRYNRADILELLISNGADLEVKSDQGFSAIKYAELSNATDVLAILETELGS